MTPTDLLTFDGTTQPISEWALDYGIPAELIIERLAEGQTVEDAITTMMPFDAPPVKHRRRARLYTHDGLALTITEWAQRIGIPRSTLAKRIESGIPISKAVNPVLEKRVTRYLHNGEQRTLSEWAAISGIKYETLHNRVTAQGLSLGEALNKRKSSKPGAHDELHTHNGETKTFAEWAAHAGMAYRTLRERMTKCGLSFGEALAMPKGSRLHTRADRPASGSASVVSITTAGVRIVIEAAGPGVVFNFEGLKGTGAGSTAQEIPEITFSAEATTE